MYPDLHEHDSLEHNPPFWHKLVLLLHFESKTEL